MMTIIEGFERWFTQILDADEKAAEATMITGDGAPKPQRLRDFPGLKIGHFNDYAGLTITFPANTSREDFERMKVEIQAALRQAELRGEQKALAFLTGEGSGMPLGIVGKNDDQANLD